MLAFSLCLGLIACGGDDEDNGVVTPSNNTQNGNTKQTLPDPEGTVTARIANDGDRYGGISLNGPYVYMDVMNNLCVYDYNGAAIINIRNVNGLAAITKVPTGGSYSDTKVATSEGDGFVIKAYRSGMYGQSSWIVICRMYLASYIRDALGNIIGATIKYQTGTDWVEKDEE